MGFGKTRYSTVFSTDYVPKTKRFFYFGNKHNPRHFSKLTDNIFGIKA